MFVHGFLLMDDKKMSKSLGNVLDPFAIIERYGSDALRYYCFREVSFGRDGSVSAAGFEARYETELANEYGNLASRTIAMVHRYRDGTVPAAALDGELAEDFEGLPEEVCALLDRAEITQALDDDLAAGAAPEPLRRGAGAVDAGKGRAAGGRAGWSARFARRGFARGERVGCIRTCRQARPGCWTRSDADGRTMDEAALRGPWRSAGGAPDRAVGAAVSQAPAGGRGAGGVVIDCHTHLDSCEPPERGARGGGGRGRG